MISVKNITSDLARRCMACGKRWHGDTGGAAAIEYMMVLTFIVIPIALMLPLFLDMIQRYAVRMVTFMRLPFP